MKNVNTQEALQFRDECKNVFPTVEWENDGEPYSLGPNYMPNGAVIMAYKEVFPNGKRNTHIIDLLPDGSVVTVIRVGFRPRIPTFNSNEPTASVRTMVADTVQELYEKCVKAGWLDNPNQE